MKLQIDSNPQLALGTSPPILFIGGFYVAGGNDGQFGDQELTVTQLSPEIAVYQDMPDFWECIDRCDWGLPARFNRGSGHRLEEIC